MSSRLDVHVPVFDGHNDTILSLRNSDRSFFAKSEQGHLDLPRAIEGGMVGGFFAVYLPDPGLAEPDPQSDPATWPYASLESMPPQMPVEYAAHETLRILTELNRLEQASGGSIRIIRTAEDLRQTLKDGVLAMELHIEGAEAIDADLGNLDVFWQAGVRSIGPVWSRPNSFGTGVPFQHPASPDIGPGLTDAGKALIRACDDLGIIVDVSHLNEAGFWDVVKTTRNPIVATHSNAWTLCASSRNLTDRQLDAIKESQGIVGVNFNAGFLHPEGRSSAAETTVVHLADHIDYLVNRLGVDMVALGSDFDGATMPSDLKDAAGLPLIFAELRQRGYADADMHAIGIGNWLRIFDRIWISA